MTEKFASLSLEEKNINLKMRSPTLGTDVVEISSLYQNMGIFTYDPGFSSTASCESKITYIDGNKGILLYRGYAIEDIAEKGSFLETCSLLLKGELPTLEEKENFIAEINERMAVPEQFHNLLQSFDREAHPMAMLMGCTSALAALYHPCIDNLKAEDRYQAALHLIAKIPTLCALIYRRSIDAAPIAPRKELSYAENFLHMCFGEESKQAASSATLAKAMDRIFILHADHEQNASTSTVRLAGSSETNAYAAITAGVASLWGPAHGGANEACLKMLHEIGEVKNIPHFIARAKDKKDPFRLMGFGHRVYKNYDPRAKIMQKTCHDVLHTLGIDDPLLDIAKELEHIALNDPYFIEKKLYPNVDFYSGITLKAMGFPTQLFTVLFALARCAGWIAQWNEMHEDPAQRIGRPRQLYTGPAKRSYVAQ